MRRYSEERKESGKRCGGYVVDRDNSMVRLGRTSQKQLLCKSIAEEWMASSSSSSSALEGGRQNRLLALSNTAGA